MVPLICHFASRAAVIDQGSASSAFYVLLSGACSVFVRDQDLAHPTSARASEAVPANPLAPPGLASCPGLPGSPPGAPPEPTLFYDPTRRGTRTTGSSGSDLPASAGHPPSVPLTVQLGGPSESGPRRGGGRFVTTNDASMPSPRASSPSRRSRFATQASALTVSATQLEPFVSFCADPVSPRGGLNRVLLDPLERPDLGSCPVSPRAPLLPPALDDLPALSRDKPPRRTVPAPFVPPPWPAEGAASTRGGGAPAAARPRSPSVKGSRTQRGTAGTSPSRPTSARGSPRGNGLRGLSDEDFEKLVSSFRGGANAAPEPSKSAGGKEPLPALRSRGREQKGATGKAEPADGAKLGGTAGAGPSGARPWKGFLLSGGDADVDPAVDAKKRYGRLVRTCVEGDAFGELELLGPEPQLR